MRIALFVVLLLMSVCAFSAESDCTFDQAQQLKVLNEVMKKHPGGKLDESKRQIAWTTKNETIEYQYGGCAHLGATVTLTQLRATPRNEKESFRAARDFAATYWEPKEAAILAEALKAKKFRLESGVNIGTYHIEHPDYSMFYLERRYEKGRDVLKISWLGNF